MNLQSNFSYSLVITLYFRSDEDEKLRRFLLVVMKNKFLFAIAVWFLKAKSNLVGKSEVGLNKRCCVQLQMFLHDRKKVENNFLDGSKSF